MNHRLIFLIVFLPAAFACGGDFESTLTAHVWSWSNPKNPNWRNGAEMRFLPDGSLIQKNEKGNTGTFTWKVVGPREIVFGPNDASRRAVFDQAMTVYKCTETWNGNDSISGTRKHPIASDSVRTVPAIPPTVPNAPVVIQSDPNQPRIEVLKDQLPNVMEWALAPLEQAVPDDIRQDDRGR